MNVERGILFVFVPAKYHFERNAKIPSEALDCHVDAIASPRNDGWRGLILLA